jgi:putative ABC transport system permease protein
MIPDYFKIAWRNLARNKFNTIINIAGLTLGITCFLIILSKINYETNFDRFHSNSDRIYRVVRVTKGLAYLEGALEYRTGVFFALPNAIKAQIPELDAATQVLYTGGGLIRIVNAKGGTQQAIFKEDRGIVLLEPDFFDVFDFCNADFNWITGNPRESLTEPFSVVLTETLAHKYFGNDSPTGKLIRIMGFDLQVTGVVSDFPQNTDFPFQLLISLSTLQTVDSDLFTNWGNLSDNFQCYVKINESTDYLQIEKKIKEIHSAHTTPEMAESRLFKLQPLNEVHNDSHFGNYNDRVISRATILSLMSIGFLLIIIACINYSNLTVAKLSSRAKVAGICKVFGGNRKRLIVQFFGETFTLTMVAMVLSILFSNIILENLSYLVGVPQDNWHFLNPQNVWLLLAVIFTVSIIAGIYPAILISKANPLEMIRNKGFKAGKGCLRVSRLTVIFQFIIAQVLIVCTLIVFGQLSFIESKDMGYERENIITVDIPDNNSMTLERFRHELTRNSNITGISFASTSPGRSRNWTDISRIVSNTSITTVTETKAVDSSYIHTFGLKLLSGRNFSDHESGLPILVNQKLIRDLQFKDEYQALGADVEFNGQDATIIGIVKDFHSDPIYESIRPCALEYNPRRFYMAGIKYRLTPNRERFHTQIEGIINDIQKQWQAIFPGQIFEYQFFDETIASYYQEEKKIASLINIFTGIMIFICCLGIVGLIYHTTNRRSKELAVRKVIGASVLDIISLLVRSFTKWVLIANLIAWPIAYYVMNKWLQNFAYRIDLSWWMFVLAGALALGIALLTISWQAIRAATANPVDSLRYE